MELCCHALNKKFYFTSVYRPCESELRDDFFIKLSHIRNIFNGLWLLRGDFNITKGACLFFFSGVVLPCFE